MLVLGLIYQGRSVNHVVLCITLYVLVHFVAADDSSYAKASNTDLIKEADDSLLLLSTLDGSFIGISQRTGIVKWQLKDEPAVKVPVDTTKPINPLYLPDPKDGSLYVLSESEQDALKKLPFTIPQLVASSPCRSNDGILYTGKKIDTWFSVDSKTGEKQPVLSFDKIDKTCPISSGETVLVGRTEYNVMMLDSKNQGRSWNVTFFDYSANSMETKDRNDYAFVHFVASSSGHTLSIDRHLGSPKWQQDYGSPVIAIYMLEDDGLVTVPFTSIADETLQHLVKQFETDPDSISSLKLYPTLYVGEHPHGMYALPSLVDQSTATIAHMGLPLLEGPVPDPLVPDVSTETPLTFQSLPKVVLGHHKVPEYSETVMRITGRNDVNTVDTRVIVGNNETNSSNNFETDHSFPTGDNSRKNNISDIPSISIGIQTFKVDTFREKLEEFYDKIYSQKASFILSVEFPLMSYHVAKAWMKQQENLGLKFTVIFLVASVVVLVYLRFQDREYLHSSQGLNNDNVSNSDSKSYTIKADIEDVVSGNIKVGKIIFNRNDILGKGCEGTFVYKGEFDRRAVAVKRILPECFTVADREVALLRESDAHPNVVRYFCTEQDHLFRYIALELCAATLQDYVEGRFQNDQIMPCDILQQAAGGLHHLHSLSIVHRDIKPHNVLLSMPNGKGEVRAMISDFGLCKKLKTGRTSFSRQSGVTGTEGWIAPEMMNGCVHATFSVDIFSLGCVFYYVLTKGKHPFGDELRRQSNIVTGLYRLADLEGEEKALQRSLVLAMITADPSSRPSAVAVQNHPLFWDSSRTLAFFQDVSDRVEKDDQSSPVLRSLEQCSPNVVRVDWRAHISDEVARDLRRFRNYTGSSVRDLLRALRNKKNHYRELSCEVQQSLGSIPEKFVEYWTRRFPLLLLHTWLAMQCVKTEPIFCQYYQPGYTFASMTVPNVGNLDFSPTSESCLTAHRTPSLDLKKKCQTNFKTTKTKHEPLTPGKFSQKLNNGFISNLNYNWRECGEITRETSKHHAKNYYALSVNCPASDTHKHEDVRSVELENTNSLKITEPYSEQQAVKSNCEAEMNYVGKLGKSSFNVRLKGKKSKTKPVEVPVVWTLPISSSET